MDFMLFLGQSCFLWVLAEEGITEYKNFRKSLLEIQDASLTSM